MNISLPFQIYSDGLILPQGSIYVRKIPKSHTYDKPDKANIFMSQDKVENLFEAEICILEKVNKFSFGNGRLDAFLMLPICSLKFGQILLVMLQIFMKMV